MVPELIPNHVAGGFEWEVPPKCQCGLLAKAIEDKWLFIPNMLNEDGNNVVYGFFVTADDDLANSSGTSLRFCPWCGDKIVCRKAKPKKDDK